MTEPNNNQNVQQEVENSAKTDRKFSGFASIPPEQRRKIASAGGKKVQAIGKGHKFTREEAKRAGRIGGMKPKPKGPKRKKAASDGGFQEAAIIAATENVMEEVALTALMQPRTLQIIVALQTTNLPMNRIAEQFEVSRQWVSAVNQKYQVRRN